MFIQASLVCISLFLPAYVVASPITRAVTACVVDPANTSPPAKCSAADPDFTQSEVSMYNNIVCPTTSGGTAAVTKPYLLVPGTGNTGAQSWVGGYVDLLGRDDGGLGFDVCYLAEPQEMLNDAQDTDERIAYAINALATTANAQPIVQGWSQGNLDIQWVLTFWESARDNSAQFLSLAGDFRGSNLVGFANVAGNFIGDLPPRDLEARQISGVPLPPSIYQQLAGSNYLTALANHDGLSGKVPTTSIYSATDEIVQPEDDTPNASSFLTSTSNGPVGDILIQTNCPGLQVSHEDQLFIDYTFSVVKLALDSPNKFASQSDVAAANIPCNTDAAPGANPLQGSNAIAAAVTNIATGPTVLEEPPVRSYAA